MAGDLAKFVETAVVFNTHEHMMKEPAWREEKPDILREVFENYAAADLVVAGATPDAVKELQNEKNPDIEKRFAPVQAAWDAAQFTGYGEVVRYLAKRWYGLDRLDGKSLAAAQEKLPARWEPGERLRILRDEGRFDHIQVDHFSWFCEPDASGPEFFLYDLSWRNFACGEIRQEALRKETGVEVRGLESLRETMAALFAKHAPVAIAVKTQHAYNRTLRWRERSDDEAAPILEKALQEAELSQDENDLLGDWCLARGVELAQRHNLPLKIHTGTYAGWGNLPIDYVRPGNLCPLLKRYPEARFVLMHIGYPYGDEMAAIAKHYPNVWVDMCWAWAINPFESDRFLRGFLRAAPANKLFAFGGDTRRPRTAVAYGVQMRRGLARVLQKEVADGFVNEAQAIGLARRFLQENQAACFDLKGRRATIQERLRAPIPLSPCGRGARGEG